MSYRYVIGVDPGVNTGVAIRDITDDRIVKLQSLKIHQLLVMLLGMERIFVIFEDARLIKNYHPGNVNIKKYQGVGSIKRDCAIIEDFLTEYDIPYQKVKPISAQTKWTSAYFKKITGYQGRTNQHTRDAGVLALMNPVVV